jgi:uncharacterized damage-inducible protein DinB
VTTLALIHDLLHHQAWADAELLRVTGSHAIASSDEKLLGALHHIVTVQRVFAAMLRGRISGIRNEVESVKSLPALQELFAASHSDLMAFMNGMVPEALERPVENPWMPDLKGTAGQILMQVILHSQGHRGQCLSRLRELTGAAPTLDFIIWLKFGRPRPAHVAGAGE